MQTKSVRPDSPTSQPGSEESDDQKINYAGRSRTSMINSELEKYMQQLKKQHSQEPWTTTCKRLFKENIIQELELSSVYVMCSKFYPEDPSYSIQAVKYVYSTEWSKFIDHDNGRHAGMDL